MPYDIKLSDEIEQEFEKLRKKDKGLYGAVMRKILKIAEEPFLGKHLRNILKGKRRVHVGHFVLFYEIENSPNKIVVIKLARHDDAY